MFQINGDKPDFISKKKGNFTFLKTLYINHSIVNLTKPAKNMPGLYFTSKSK